MRGFYLIVSVKDGGRRKEMLLDFPVMQGEDEKACTARAERYCKEQAYTFKQMLLEHDVPDGSSVKIIDEFI